MRYAGSFWRLWADITGELVTLRPRFHPGDGGSAQVYLVYPLVADGIYVRLFVLLALYRYFWRWMIWGVAPFPASLVSETSHSVNRQSKDGPVEWASVGLVLRSQQCGVGT